MTIPRLNGWWDEIAPGVNTLAQALPNIINPNADYQRKVRDLIAQNPDLIYQYAQMERDNPGTLEAMKLGQLAKIVKTLPENSKNMGERQARQFLTEIDSDPVAREERKATVTGTQTSIQRQKDQLDIEGKTTSNAIGKIQLDFEKKRQEFADVLLRGDAAVAQQKAAEWQMLAPAYQAVPQILQRVNNDVFTARRKGEISNEEMALINMIPAAREQYDQGYKIWNEENAERRHREMLAMRRAEMSSRNVIDNIIARQKAELAGDIAAGSFSGGVNPETILQLWQLPKPVQDNLRNMSQEQIQAAVSGGQMPQETAVFWEAAQAHKRFEELQGPKQRMLQLEVTKRALTLSKPEYTTYLKIATNPKSSPADRENAVAALNNLQQSEAVRDAYAMQGMTPPTFAVKKGFLGGAKHALQIISDKDDPALKSLTSELGISVPRVPMTSTVKKLVGEKPVALSPQESAKYDQAVPIVLSSVDKEETIRQFVSQGANEAELRSRLSKAGYKGGK